MAAPSMQPPARHSEQPLERRPQPGPRVEQPVLLEERVEQRPIVAARGRRWGRRQDPVQVAGSAIVTAAKVGRILGRSGWRIARQLPGVAVVEQLVEQQVTRLISPEEERTARLVENAATDPAPLRTAMTELLERSTASSPASSRDYLFGTIVSQLVPDEARILAVLADGRPQASIDVVGKKDARLLVGNVSTVAHSAGVALPASGPTYLDRLDGFGLLAFLAPQPGDERQYAALAGERSVQAAMRDGARVIRKSITLSPLGREFWAACAPGR